MGKTKAQVAADFVNTRVPGCNVISYPYRVLFLVIAMTHIEMYFVYSCCPV